MTEGRWSCGAFKSSVSLISFSFSLRLSLWHILRHKKSSGVFLWWSVLQQRKYETPRGICQWSVACSCVYVWVFTEHVWNSQTHVRHSSPWHTAEVWLIKDEFRGSMTVLFAPPPTYPAAKRKDGMKDGERGQGPLWSPQDRTVNGPLTQSEGWMEKIEGCSEYAEKEWSLMPAACLCNYSSFSLTRSSSQIPLLPSLPLFFFKYPSLCPLPADLCQPPWNHRHIRAFKGHRLASCSHQTYYSPVVQTHTHVRVCVT